MKPAIVLLTHPQAPHNAPRWQHFQAASAEIAQGHCSRLQAPAAGGAAWAKMQLCSPPSLWLSVSLGLSFLYPSLTHPAKWKSKLLVIKCHLLYVYQPCAFPCDKFAYAGLMLMCAKYCPVIVLRCASRISVSAAYSTLLFMGVVDVHCCSPSMRNAAQALA